MNPVKREENKSFSATEYDQSTRPEVSRGTGMEQTCAGTPGDHSPSDNRGCGSTIAVKCEVSGHETCLKTRNPYGRDSKKRYFTFTLDKRFGKLDHSVYTASGEPNENIYSALTANENFCEMMEKHFNKDVIAYEEKTIGGYVNLGMPLKCLPTRSHLKILFDKRKENKKENDTSSTGENDHKKENDTSSTGENDHKKENDTSSTGENDHKKENDTSSTGENDHKKENDTSSTGENDHKKENDTSSTGENDHKKENDTSSTGEIDQLLRLYKNPSDVKCILFQVVAIGKATKNIVKIRGFHEKASTLCVYALKGETIQEALCKDGRFRSDLDQLKWRLIENHKKVYEKQSRVEDVSGKTLEMEIPKKPPVKKHTHKKIEQKNESATGEISPQDLMPSQVQVLEPKTDGDTKDIEYSQKPQSLRHDIEDKKRRTISEIKNHYQENYKIKYRKQISLIQQSPYLVMQSAINWDIPEKTTDLWLKNCKMLDKVIIQQYPNFSKYALHMKEFFREEQRKNKLSPSQQFDIYEKNFAKATKNSTTVADYEFRTQRSKSVGLIYWDKGNATCFVFNDGYIFTCQHVVHLMVGEGTDPSLWPDIISKCAKVTFIYKESLFSSKEWFSIEPWFEVYDKGLDYAILKLRANGNGFPPGLFEQISSLPPRGLLYLIGHPEGQVKQVDECAVITIVDRVGRYSDLAFSMFTSKSFPPVAWSSDALSYDTCFMDGSSGSPVFNAAHQLVAIHSFGHVYEREGKECALIEFGYSMESILHDIKQKNEAFYKLLTKEKNENLNQEKNNKQELSLQNHQMEPMEH